METFDAVVNSIVTINPHAADDAARLDDHHRRTGTLRGPLHGLPVVIKDNIDVAGLATAFGSVAFAEHLATRDAVLVTRLKDAGAVVLGKTTMPDFAASWHGHSSRSGITRNPYDTARDPGGSSSGSAAAVAAEFAVAGIGTDTGGSIRIPAALCGLVGLRPSVGLVSRTGTAALVRQQDSPGPMARCVADVAALLDVLAGWDHRDPDTALPSATRRDGTFTDRITAGALRGARIGVVRELGAVDPAVAGEIDRALAAMRSRGAVLVEVELPGLSGMLLETSMYFLQSRRDLNEYLAHAGAPTQDVGEVVARGDFFAHLALLPLVAAGPRDPCFDPAYARALECRTHLRNAVAGLFAEYGLAALAYPTVRIGAPLWADVDAGTFEDGPAGRDRSPTSFPTNTLIAAQCAFPALTLPVGQTGDGLPVGLELLGLPHHDGDLLALAHDLELACPARPVPTDYQQVVNP
ncbi:amidase [Pseudonocardia kujensis]|uniref:amidase n=1 Tax=Pseudonocardia kujensis TaxID=1128675 RepID=UPI001E55F1FF|nr:amidase [Pseudonocardia kujensis]MCE0765024.1 amidase [Pseudonocardia kujensis]